MASLSLHHDAGRIACTERLESARLERLALDAPRAGLGGRLARVFRRPEPAGPAPRLRAYESRSTA